jgi:hypothetical protein
VTVPLQPQQRVCEIENHSKKSARLIKPRALGEGAEELGAAVTSKDPSRWLEQFNSVLRIAPMRDRSGWCHRSRRFRSRFLCLAQTGNPSSQPYLFTLILTLW